MDEATYEALYRDLHGAVFGYARASLAPHEARDVVSETFEVVWRKRRSAPTEPEALRQWCFGIARKKILQERQRRVRKHHDNRFSADHSSEGMHNAPDVAERVVTTRVAEQMWHALQAEDQQLLAILVTSEGSAEENAARLGTSYTAYMSRVWRVRKRLEQMMLGSASEDSERPVRP